MLQCENVVLKCVLGSVKVSLAVATCVEGG